MSKRSRRSPIVLLHGLEQEVSSALSATLESLGYSVHIDDSHSSAHCITLARHLRACALFCCSLPERYLELLREPERDSGLPVIVVSRVPEVVQWLDALEAGASDYCAAPFERRHVEWLMESARIRS